MSNSESRQAHGLAISDVASIRTARTEWVRERKSADIRQSGAASIAAGQRDHSAQCKTVIIRLWG